MEVFRLRLCLILMCASASISNGEDGILNTRATLRPISTIYLPYDYQNDGDPEFGIDVGAVEQGVMDTDNMMYYGAGMLLSQDLVSILQHF